MARYLHNWDAVGNTASTRHNCSCRSNIVEDLDIVAAGLGELPAPRRPPQLQ